MFPFYVLEIPGFKKPRACCPVAYPNTAYCIVMTLIIPAPRLPVHKLPAFLTCSGSRPLPWAGHYYLNSIKQQM